MARENAVVVSGDSLTSIFKMNDPSLMRMFVDLCENANVVLACRVSPKQKAEVVTMMRRLSSRLPRGRKPVACTDALHMHHGSHRLHLQPKVPVLEGVQRRIKANTGRTHSIPVEQHRMDGQGIGRQQFPWLNGTIPS